MPGFSHVGVATLDIETTIDFYTRKLGFRRVADHRTSIREGGELRQVYFEVGCDEFIVFMAPTEVEGIPNSFPTGINEALGTPAGMYHFAFKVDSMADLEAMRDRLLASDIDVSDCIDLGHAHSIFLADPNGLQIEFCFHSRPFEAADLTRTDEASIA